MRRVGLFAAAMVCLLTAAPLSSSLGAATAPAPIFTQTGSGTAQTAVFKVPSDWDLAWTYDCSNFLGGSGNFIVSIYDYYGENSQLDLDNQGVNQLGHTGNGVDHFHSGGNKKFLKVVSECNWTLTVAKPVTLTDAARSTKTKHPKKTNKKAAPVTTVVPAAPIFMQTGSGTAQTAVFKVPSDWDLAWTYDCSNFLGGSGNFIVSIYDYYGKNSQLDLDNQGVNQLGHTGNGVDHFHSGGNKKFLKVGSECNWSVTVTKGKKG